MISKKQLAMSLNVTDILGQGKIGVYVKYKPTNEENAPTYERFIRSSGSRSIVISKDGKILLTSEYRHEDKKWDIRLPGGKVCDRIEDYVKALNESIDLVEAARAGAIKELREEAGIEAHNAEFFKMATSGGSTVDWNLYYFVVTDFSVLPTQQLEQGEDIKVGWYSIPEVIEICLSDKFGEARSAAVVLRYLHSIGKI